MIASLLRGYSIRTRMTGAILLVLGMFALVGAAGLYGGLRLKALNEEIGTHSIAEARHINAIRTHLGLVRLHEKQMVIDYESAERVDKQRGLWLTEMAATERALQALLEGEADEDNALARDAVTELAAYAKASEPVLRQIQAGGYDNARAVDKMLGRAKEHMGRVEANVEKIDAVVVAEAAHIQAEFQAAIRQVVAVFCGALALVVVAVVPLTLLNSRSITGPIDEARRLAQAIAGGDLTRPIHAEGRDEASQLLGALQQMQTWLRDVVGNVRQSSSNIEIASHEVAAGNADLSGRTEQAASSLQQTASSMEQLTGTVGQSADAARQASQLAGSAAEVAQRGGSVVAQVVATMQEINAASRKIADIIGTIDGIAFQTNILALNAAVEAARAGEQGRGFAVVASEVRSLAQRSAQAAREIKTLIGSSVEKVENGSRLVADAGSTMDEIVASVQRVADIIGEVTAASSEQSAGIGQVSGAVAQLDQMTQQNAALVEQTAASAQSLRAQADGLATLVASFRLGGEAAPIAAGVIASARQRAPAARTGARRTAAALRDHRNNKENA